MNIWLQNIPEDWLNGEIEDGEKAGDLILQPIQKYCPKLTDTPGDHGDHVDPGDHEDPSDSGDHGDHEDPGDPGDPNDPGDYGDHLEPEMQQHSPEMMENHDYPILSYEEGNRTTLVEWSDGYVTKVDDVSNDDVNQFADLNCTNSKDSGSDDMNPAEITNVSTNPCMLSCGQCDYVATRSDNLKMHIKNKHDLVRYPCDLCDYKSTRESDLRRHKKTVHKLQGILSGTKRKATVVIQMKDENGCIVYSCDQCDYSAGTIRTVN